MDVFLSAPGFEEALIRELGGAARVACRGVVIAEGPSRDLARTDPVFARQVLPGAEALEAPSIARMAHAAVDWVLPRVEAGEGPWRFETLLPDEPEDPHLPGELSRRAALAHGAFLAALKARRRRTWRRLDTAGAPGTPRVQALWVSRGRCYLSHARPALLDGGSWWPSPFPAGRPEVAEDRAAPSRAYRKLVEALAWLGRAPLPGERCVDLGAAPGGWTHVALRLGARVVAVDRAALAPALDGHPRLTQLRGDGFRYTPEDPPVDWLLSDLIAYPARGLALLARWAGARWFRRTVFHLKFKGRADYSTAAEAIRVLREAGYPLARAKHLYHDRNEVTVLGAESRGP